MKAEDTSTTESVEARQERDSLGLRTVLVGEGVGEAISRIYNQLFTGTINIYTLLHSLGRTEQLWAFMECQNVES